MNVFIKNDEAASYHPGLAVPFESRNEIHVAISNDLCTPSKVHYMSTVENQEILMSCR